MESDVRLSADGVAVLVHDGRFSWRRRRVAATPRAELPEEVPTLDELYRECGTDFELSLDIKDAEALGPVIDVARAHDAAERLWLCHPGVATLADHRALDPDVKLVNSTRLSRIREGPERRAADLREAGLDGMNMHESDWTRGLVTLFRRFGLFCLGWDAHVPRLLDRLLATGVDGVFSDDVPMMMELIARRDA